MRSVGFLGLRSGPAVLPGELEHGDEAREDLAIARKGRRWNVLGTSGRCCRSLYTRGGKGPKGLLRRQIN